MPEEAENTGLRYLEADNVEHSAGTFAGLAVCTDRDEQLGALNGVLIEPATRRLRYFVLEPPARPRERCVLAADTPAVLDMQEHKLRVQADPDDLQRLREPVPRFSDEDVLTALFSNPAA